MNLNWKRILILFSIALNIGFVVYGIGHSLSRQVGWHRGTQNREKVFYHQLDLAEDQRLRLDQLLNEHSIRQQELKTANRQTRLALARLLASYKEEERPRLEELIARLATIKKEREQLTAEHLLQVKTILDARQSERFFNLLLKTVEREKE